jgi:hypothetical protein
MIFYDSYGFVLCPDCNSRMGPLVQDLWAHLLLLCPVCNTEFEVLQDMGEAVELRKVDEEL